MSEINEAATVQDAEAEAETTDQSALNAKAETVDTAATKSESATDTAETSDSLARSAKQAVLDKVVAIVKGQPLTEYPQDLYIPPEALEIILEAFEGPLDLLLYLIRKHNLDILDIPIAKITEQYMQYVDVMRTIHVELAAEYLVMAAILAEIKSRLLLPRPETEEETEEIDPRAKLVEQLQAYERLKLATQALDERPRLDRDLFVANSLLPELSQVAPLPTVMLKELALALQAVLARQQLVAHHHVQQEPLSVRDRMTLILEKLQDDQSIEFTDLFTREESRLGVVVSFIALLELLKQSVIEIVQSQPFSPIYLRKRMISHDGT